MSSHTADQDPSFTADRHDNGTTDHSQGPATRNRGTAPRATPQRQLTALFDRVLEHCIPRMQGWILKSPIWELELTCSSMQLTPDRATQRTSPHHSHAKVTSRLFLETRSKEKASTARDTSSETRARTAPVRRIALIKPPLEDPGVRRRVTRLSRPPTRPRGPTTQIIGRPDRPRLAPRHHRVWNRELWRQRKANKRSHNKLGLPIYTTPHRKPAG